YPPVHRPPDAKQHWLQAVSPPVCAARDLPRYVKREAKASCRLLHEYISRSPHSVFQHFRRVSAWTASVGSRGRGRMTRPQGVPLETAREKRDGLKSFWQCEGWN